MAEKIIIDCDPGIDDMLAIFYALASDALDVVGITTVYGNVPAETGAQNALRLIEMAGRSNIPVAVGARNPLCGTYSHTFSSIHGKDGLGNTHLPEPIGKPIAQTAVDFIVEQVDAHPGEITLAPIGPLTNIALAIQLHPHIVSKVKRVVLMGGAAFVPGNVNPASEANIHSDPEAAVAVFKADWDLTMLGLDVTRNIRLTDEDIQRFARSNKSTAQLIAKAVPNYLKFYKKKYGKNWCQLHDPSVISYILHPSLFEVKQYPMTIGLHGSGRGKTWAWMPWHLWNTTVDADKKVTVVLNADADQVLQEMFNALI
jgi:purine nucleosidase